MPRRHKNWAPLDHLINEDPEVWAFTDWFGDRALRTLAQVIINIDKSDNEWKLTGNWAGVLGRLTHQYPRKVREQVIHMIDTGWLVPKVSSSTREEPEKIGRRLVEETQKKGSCLVLGSPNYARFHPKQVHKGYTHNITKHNITYKDKEKSADAPLSFPKSENIGLGEKDPAQIVGDELWGRLEAMWREKGKRLSIWEREAIGLQLRELAKAGQDPARVVRKALQGGWLHLHPVAGGKELPDSGETLDEIKARIAARNGGADGKNRLQ